MKTKIIAKSDYLTTRWSGGTTGQVVIWPENANFNKREFIWRISLATLEDESSVFTSFSRFQRILYLLDGKSTLLFQQENGEQQTRELHPGQQARFEGAWETRSQGRASDLNLIMRQGTCGGIRTLTLEPLPDGKCGDRWWHRPVLYSGPDSCCAYLLYVRKGTVSVDGQVLSEGDSVLLLAEEDENCLRARLHMSAFGSGCVLAECVVCWRD